MNSRPLLFGGLAALALLGGYGAWRASRPDENQMTSSSRNASGMIRIGNGGMVSTGSASMQMPAAMIPKPSRDLNSPVHSPDGRFIAFQLSKNRGLESTYMHGVMDASSGQVVSVSEESGASAAPVWLAPRRLLGGIYDYTLVREGTSWKFHKPSTLPTGMFGAQPATFSRPDITNVSPEATLRAADLALWFLQAPNSGSGHIGVSSLATGEEIALPAALSSLRNSRTTRYAAPGYKAGAMRALAELNRIPGSFDGYRLEVWNLSKNKRLFAKVYQGASGANLHWTRDGRYLIVSGLEPTSKLKKEGATFSRDRGIEIFDARTGKLLTTQNVSGQSGGFIGGDAIVVSDDGKYFITRRTFTRSQEGVSPNRTYQLAICALPTGRVLSTFERQREFEQLPHFTSHDSRQLVWAAKDTIFLQSWKPSQTPQKLAPRRFKLNLNSPLFR